MLHEQEPNQPWVAASQAVETTLSGLQCQHHLSVFRQIAVHVLSPSPSVCFSCAASVPLFTQFADVAVLSTSLATIGRRVLLLGGWDVEAFPWKMQLHGSAERLEAE